MSNLPTFRDFSHLNAEGGEAAAMATVVKSILESAMTVASRRGGSGDVVHGLIAGLRLLRSVVEDEVGAAMVSAMDNAVRSRMLIEKMAQMRHSGRMPEPVSLPEPGHGLTATAAIFQSAAESCLTINAHAEDNGPLELAISGFSAQLLERLGGAPDWPELSRELRRPFERSLSVETTVLPEGGTIH